MDAADPVFMGLDLAGACTLPAMLALFAFAIWWGVTRCTAGIDEAEQTRRMEEPGRF